MANTPTFKANTKCWNFLTNFVQNTTPLLSLLKDCKNYDDDRIFQHCILYLQYEQ